MKKSIIALFGLAALFYSSRAENDVRFELVLKSGKAIPIKSFSFVKKSVVFYDSNDLERFYPFSKAKVIKRFGEKRRVLIKVDGKKYEGDFLKAAFSPPIIYLENGKKTLAINFGEEDSVAFELSEELALSSSDYFECGVNLGFPAALNLTAGATSGNFGLKLSGNYIWLAYGAELGLEYRYRDDAKTRLAAGVCGGFSNIKKDKYGNVGDLIEFDWRYVGVYHSLLYRGFYAQIGLSVGKGDYKQGQVLFQIGYIYRVAK